MQIGAQNYPPGLHRWWKKNHISVIWVPPSCHTNKASIPNFRTNRKPNHIGNIFNTSLNIFPSLMVGFLELPIFGWKPIFLHIAPWCYDWTWDEMVGFSSHDTPFVSGPNGMWKSPTRNLWFLWFRWFHFDGPKREIPYIHLGHRYAMGCSPFKNGAVGIMGCGDLRLVAMALDWHHIGGAMI